MCCHYAISNLKTTLLKTRLGWKVMGSYLGTGKVYYHAKSSLRATVIKLSVSYILFRIYCTHFSSNVRDLALHIEQRSKKLQKLASATATICLTFNYETIRFEKLSTSAFLINFSKHCSCRKNWVNKYLLTTGKIYFES